MRPGRNDPCPCGSGKKYKRCCYLKDQITGASNNEESVFDERDFLLNALINLRRFTLDKKPHIKEYYRIRKMHGEIVDAMIEYYDGGSFKQEMNDEAVSQTDGEKTVYLIESSFDLDTRVGAQGFYDMLIYKTALNTSCITEDFIRRRRYRKAEKVEFLHSMLDSKPGLFEITGTDPDEGRAYLKDVFTGSKYTVTDVGLSGNQNYSDFYLYTRIISYNGVCFGTGLNLIFEKTDGFIQSHIRKHKKDYSPNGEFLRFSQLYNRYSKTPDKIRVAVNTLR